MGEGPTAEWDFNVWTFCKYIFYFGKNSILEYMLVEVISSLFTRESLFPEVTPIGRSYHFRSPTTGCPPRVIASLCASAPGAAGLDTSQILEPLTLPKRFFLGWDFAHPKVDQFDFFLATCHRPGPEPEVVEYPVMAGPHQF